MRPLSRYQPVNERRHVAFDTNIIENKRVHEENGSNPSGKYFAQIDINDRKKKLNEMSELRSYFVSASCNKHSDSHPSLNAISTKEKSNEKGNSFKDFMLLLFSR